MKIQAYLTAAINLKRLARRLFLHFLRDGWPAGAWRNYPQKQPTVPSMPSTNSP
jgi:hypothetical protein